MTTQQNNRPESDFSNTSSYSSNVSTGGSTVQHDVAPPSKSMSSGMTDTLSFSREDGSLWMLALPAALLAVGAYFYFRRSTNVGEGAYASALTDANQWNREPATYGVDPLITH